MSFSLVARCRSLLALRAALSDRHDWKARRAPLANADRALQSETHDWLRQIPRWLHPTQLCRYYPRLANRIAQRWADAPQVARLLSDLMIDRRGQRRGFAPRITEEIGRLYRHNAERMNALLPGSSPAAPQRRVDVPLKLAVRPVRK
jgi:hypothetical protein